MHLPHGLGRRYRPPLHAIMDWSACAQRVHVCCTYFIAVLMFIVFEYWLMAGSGHGRPLWRGSLGGSMGCPWSDTCIDHQRPQIYSRDFSHWFLIGQPPQVCEQLVRLRWNTNHIIINTWTVQRRIELPMQHCCCCHSYRWQPMRTCCHRHRDNWVWQPPWYQQYAANGLGRFDWMATVWPRCHHCSSLHRVLCRCNGFMMMLTVALSLMVMTRSLCNNGFRCRNAGKLRLTGSMQGRPQRHSTCPAVSSTPPTYVWHQLKKLTTIWACWCRM